MTPLHDPDFGKKAMARLKSCFDHLRSQVTDPNIAVIGFCFGGTYSFSLAVKEPELKLAMPFYGHANQSAQELEAIGCPVRAFYGENDENLMKDLPDLKDRMDQAGVDFQATRVYPDCGHAFFNDTNRFAYNEPAADDAWQKVLENLRSYL